MAVPTMAPRIMQEVDAIRHTDNDQGDDRRLSDLVNKSSTGDYKWEFTSPKKDRRPLRPSRAHEMPDLPQDTPTRRSVEQCTPTKASWTPSKGGCSRNSTGMIPDEIHVLLSKSLTPPNVGQDSNVNNLLTPRRDETVPRGDVNKWASPKKDKRPSAPLSRAVRQPTCDCVPHRWSDITPTPNLSSPPPPTSNEARILELQVELLELLLAQHQHENEDDIDSSAFDSPRATPISTWITSSPKWESLNKDSRPLRPIKNLSCNNTLAGSSVCSSFAAGLQSEDERSVVSLSDTRGPSGPQKQNSFSYCSLAGSSFCSSSYGAGVPSEDERSLASLKDARPRFPQGPGSIAYSDTIATSANSSFLGGSELEDDDVKRIDF